MTPKIDKEFAALIPPLTEEEFQQLEKNLLAEGCRDRLVVWGEILIDGHNRLRICTLHSIPYEVTERDFEDRNAAMQYIILNQFGRRNLSPGNRSLLALKLEPLYKAKAKENQRQSPGRGQKGVQNSAHLFDSDKRTRDKVAEVAGVSHNTIDKVRKIVNHGTPDQVERIKDGGKGNSIRAVYDEVRKLSVPPPLPRTDPVKKTVADDRPRDPPLDTNGKDTDLQRIRGYVAELKNPDLNRSYTADMFLSEYKAFSDRFICNIEAFAHEPYRDTYPLLTAAQRKKMRALGGAMIEAIEQQLLLMEGAPT